MTLQVPGEPPVEDLFLCLVSNVSPWTYLGARPVNPSPEASFDAGLDVFAMGRMGSLRMLRDAAPDAGRRPDARGAAGVHRRHDLEELTLTAVAAARAGSWTATTWAPRPGCACGTCPPRCASSPEPVPDAPSRTSRRARQRHRAGVWFGRVAGLARPW